MVLSSSMSFDESALFSDAIFYRHQFDLREAFARDPRRFESLSISAPGVMADLSKSLWDVPVLTHLLGLASSAGLATRRAAMFSGEAINETEGRAVLHAPLRAAVQGNAEATASESLSRDVGDMLDLAEDIRARPEIRDVVHIGIGGSSLGPELALQALADFGDFSGRIHFVSNIDGHQLGTTLAQLRPASTIFVVASKSFLTLETLRNAYSALDWFQRTAPHLPTQPHFVAITSQPEKARAMGFGAVLGMPEGIGGRYSLWSSIGLPVAVSVGRANFLKLLDGAVDMDQHFLKAPLEKNLPVWLGMLDVWYSTYLQFTSRCVVPYHHGLRRLPAYLQQLDMESNGKRVKLDGNVVQGSTGMCVWGEVGTDSQHSFFQWLHQGTHVTPVEFIVARNPCHALKGHHEPLLANAIAQAQALMLGKTAEGDVTLAGHRDFPGNRPSAFFVLDQLSPYTLGAFLALQEHRVFVAGVVWGINSFDQWGVELGKVLAQDIGQRLVDGKVQGLDASTAGLVRLLHGRPEEHDPPTRVC